MKINKQRVLISSGRGWGWGADRKIVVLAYKLNTYKNKIIATFFIVTNSRCCTNSFSRNGKMTVVRGSFPRNRENTEVLILGNLVNDLYGLYLEFQKKVFKQLSELKLMMVELLEKRSQGPASTNELLPKQVETMEDFDEFDGTLKEDKQYRSTVSF